MVCGAESNLLTFPWLLSETHNEGPQNDMNCGGFFDEPTMLSWPIVSIKDVDSVHGQSDATFNLLWVFNPVKFLAERSFNFCFMGI